MAHYVLVIFLVLTCFGMPARADMEDPDEGWEDDWLIDDLEESIGDPLEPLNRFFFEFNDRLYFLVLRPVASGYAYLVPAGIRMPVANFFKNLMAPVRIANNLLQVKPRATGIELSRFIINSTIGIAGLGDPARTRFGLEPRVEDFGQTLGYYGIGDGWYLVLPILGPSNLRDSVGRLGDSFLSPVDILILHRPVPGLSVAGLESVNQSSFRIGEYEQFREMAFDPYLAVRDAYQQYRRGLIEDRRNPAGRPFSVEGDF